MQISLQRNSCWLDKFSYQNLPGSGAIIQSGDGRSYVLPLSFLVASSPFLYSLLLPPCSSCYSSTPTICLPSTTGFTLHLLSQIFLRGETEHLVEDNLETCMKSVQDVLDLLKSDVNMVLNFKSTKTNVSRNDSFLDTEENMDTSFVVEDIADDTIDDCGQLENSGMTSRSSAPPDSHRTKNIRNCSVNLERCSKSSEKLELDRIDINGESEDCNVQVLKCPFCDRSFKKIRKLMNHKKRRHGNIDIFIDEKIGKYYCNKCALNHACKKSLIRHINVKHGTGSDAPRREFQCDECDLGFFTAAGLVKHRSDRHRENDESKDFQCSLCNLGYYTETSLLKHQLDRHGNDASVSSSTSTSRLGSFEGPFSCSFHLCDYSCMKPSMFNKHWNLKHKKVAAKATFTDQSTSTVVSIYQVYTFILQCKLCGDVKCSSKLMRKAVEAMSNHVKRSHGVSNVEMVSRAFRVLQDENGKMVDEEVIPSEDSSDKFSLSPVEEFSLVRSFSNNNKRVLTEEMNEDKDQAEDSIDYPLMNINEQVLTIPKLTDEISNTSFSQKGFYGPYHCLKQGCGFVCDKFGKITQKLLVNHWCNKHGDVRSLLFLDTASFTILNVLLVCNNVGYCTFNECTNILYASRRTDLPASVSNHWKNQHPISGISRYNPNMCRLFSSKEVSNITKEEVSSIISKVKMKNIENVKKHVMGRTSPILKVLSDKCIDEAQDNSELENKKNAPVGHAGPFKCSECDYIIIPSTASSVNHSSMLNHWVKEHSSADKLCFVDESTGEILTARSFFHTVAECSKCDHVLGNCGGQEFYSMLKLHWASEHSEEKECDDDVMFNIVNLEEEESVCSKDSTSVSDLTDKDKINSSIVLETEDWFKEEPVSQDKEHAAKS